MEQRVLFSAKEIEFSNRERNSSGQARWCGCGEEGREVGREAVPNSIAISDPSSCRSFQKSNGRSLPFDES
jgi:hypothetical protein